MLTLTPGGSEAETSASLVVYTVNSANLANSIPMIVEKSATPDFCGDQGVAKPILSFLAATGASID